MYLRHYVRSRERARERESGGREHGGRGICKRKMLLVLLNLTDVYDEAIRLGH